MTTPEAIKLMAVLRAAYPNQTILPETVDVYASMLQDIDFMDMQRAIKHVIAECKFFPTIAELRSAVVIDHDGPPAAELAWGEVMQQVRRVGMYGTPTWSSVVVGHAVRAIGWENICLCELDQLNTLRSQFLRVMAAYRDRDLREQNLAGLDDPDPGRDRLPAGEERQPRPLRDIAPFERWAKP